jgi:photosystem II stability/assembly factor-like uncharacterized protein
MKFLLIVLLASSSTLSAQWDVVYNFPFIENTDNTIYNLEYNGLDKLFILKDRDVLVSTDWGMSWDTSYTSNEQGQFRQIYFNSPDTGYMVKAVGPGLFLRTYDAGENWETVVPVSGVYSVEATSVFVLDKDHIYFSIWDGVSGKIVWTSDGGLTTQLAYPAIWEESGISGMACKDADTCVAVSGHPLIFGGGDGNEGLCPVYRTDSCCNDWEYSTYTYYGTQKLIYRNWNLMYTYTPIVAIRSNDQFQNWDTIMFFEDVNDEFMELHFVNDSVGYLSIRRLALPGDELPTRVLRTTDYGETWAETTFDWSLLNPDTLFRGSINAIECLSETDCFLMAGRTLFRTTNGGLANTQDIAGLPLTLHPNPASLVLEITGLNNYPFAITTTVSLNGQAVQLDFKNGQADIAALPAGIYITRVQTDYGLWQEKWVKL